METVWLDGVNDKYPKELFEGRINVEASVIGLLWKDPLILDEVKLSKEDFKSYDGRLFFGIISELRRKNLNEFNQVAVMSNLNETTQGLLEKRGGYKAISKLSEIISEKNRDSILDSLSKYNLYLRLYDKGFNLLGEVTIGNKEQKPIKFFEKLSTQEIAEWYDCQINEMTNGTYTSKLLIDEDVDIGEEFIQQLKNKEEEGLNIGYVKCKEEDEWFDQYGVLHDSEKDVNGEEINAFSYLNKTIHGLKRGGSTYIAGFSSVGKTCLWSTITMSVASKEKVLIICNEQNDRTWKLNFILFILYKKFRYFTLTKSKLISGSFDKQDEEYLAKATKYFNENYKGRIHFIQMSENNTSLIKTKIRQYHLQYGYNVIIYDTLKAQDTKLRDNNVSGWEELVQLSRDLDMLAKKYDLYMCASMQLKQTQRNSLFLDSSMLSGATGVVEVLDCLIGVRIIYQEELDPESNFYIHPFRRKKKDNVWIEEPVELERGKAYRAIFLCKSRNSSNSESDGICLIYKFNGANATFSEVAYGRPSHGSIGQKIQY